MSEFVKLFEKYGYKVEPFGKSYIADNGIFCVPFTEREGFGYPEVSAISFLSCDKEDIKKTYKNSEYIGYDIFSDWSNNRLKYHRFGGICNHDHSLYEVEKFLNVE
jgi:hypothetical protein